MHRGLFFVYFYIYIKVASELNIHGILIFPPEPPSLHNGRSRCSYQHRAPERWREGVPVCREECQSRHSLPYKTCDGYKAYGNRNNGFCPMGWYCKCAGIPSPILAFLLQDDRDTSRLHSPDALRTAQTAKRSA